MANNKKGAQKSAAQQAAAQQQAPANNQQKIDVIQAGDLLDKMKDLAGNRSALSPDATVMALNGLKTMVHDNPNAAAYYGMSEDSVKQLNHFTLAGFATVLAIEVMQRKSPFAVTMLANQPEAINAISEYTGVSIDTKYLPAPDAEGKVLVNSEAVTISKEAQEGLKEEGEIASRKVETDPTKVENETQLKDSLLNMLVKGGGITNFYQKVLVAVNFYRAYICKKAKAENNEEEYNKAKNASTCDILSEIASFLGKCPFTIGGMAKYMFEQTERSKSPVAAFCQLRDANIALNKDSGNTQINEQILADIVKVLVRWYANSEIQSANESIAAQEKNIEVMKKDAKKNAKGIESANKIIETIKSRISAVNEVVVYVNVPDQSIVNRFAEDYKDNKAEGFKIARMIGSKIAHTYYPDVDLKSVNMDNLVHNLQQHMGIITNMFLPPLSQMVNYSAANLTELEIVKKEEPKN